VDNSFDLSFLPGSGGKRAALVVNIFGGPGAGKSTLASRLFSELKSLGLEAACPEEHAKLALWSGQPWLLDQQVVLLGRTWETLHALHDKVDVVVVDSPLLLCSVYAGQKEGVAFHDLVVDLHRRHPRLNLLLNRPELAAYSTNGRRESEVEALAKDDAIRNRLMDAGEGFFEIERTDCAARCLAERIAYYVSDPG